MKKHKTAVLVGILVLIAVGVAVYFFFFAPSQPEEVIENAQSEESSFAEDVQEEEGITPLEVELNLSDDLVRKLAAELSSNPLMARWLITDYLIRRFVTTVDLIANGDSPRRPMDFIEVTDDLQISEADGQVSLDPASYERYNSIAEVILSLDAEGCAEIYKQLQLPIQQAYKEMGYPDDDFNETLRRAIEALLDTPVVEDKIYLEKDVVTYLMVDPDLENLSPAQKHLLRMGPENLREVQIKLREIAQYLDFEVQEDRVVD